LSQLLKSLLFYDPACRGCIIKTPLEYIVGTLRGLDVVMPSKEGVISIYYGWIGLMLTGGNMQMNLLEPPNVAGWPAYYQVPEFHEIWLNADTLDSRVKFVDDIVSNKYQIAVQTFYTTLIDPTVIAQHSSDPSNPDTLIKDWMNLLYPNPLTTDQIKTLHDTLLPGLPNYEWTNEWTAFKNNPNDAAGKQAVSDKLSVLLKHMLELAEYQLT
jgi:hypothetical protein